MIDILVGDCLDTLKTLPEKPVNTCVTSPPYYGLRDYKVDGQIGLEASPDEYIAALVKVFGEVKRVLKDDGTLWVNIGDSYARNPAKGGSGPGGKNREWYGEGYTSARSEVRRVQRISLFNSLPWYRKIWFVLTHEL